MNVVHAELSDTVSIRQAARLPCALMVVGTLPELAARREELIMEGFDVVAVPTAAEARARQELTPCSIVLATGELPEAECDMLVSCMRAQSNSAYVYLISQVVDECSAARDVDDWVATSAGFDELLSRLRAARRIVTLERTCRVENDTSRMRALVDQVRGPLSGQFLASEAARRLHEMRRPDQAAALLLVRSVHAELGAEQVACIVQSLFGATSNGMDVVASLSPVTFALLLPELDEHAAPAVQEQVEIQLAQDREQLSATNPWSPLQCGVATLRGPVDNPLVAFRQLVLAAEQNLRAIDPAARATQDEPVGA